MKKLEAILKTIFELTGINKPEQTAKFDEYTQAKENMRETMDDLQKLSKGEWIGRAIGGKHDT